MSDETPPRPKKKPRGRPFTTDNQPGPERKGPPVGFRPPPKLLVDMRAVAQDKLPPRRLSAQQKRLKEWCDRDFAGFTRELNKLEQAHMAANGKRAAAEREPEAAAEDLGTERALAILREFLDREGVRQ